MSKLKAIVLAVWIAISGIYNVFDIASWASDSLKQVNIAYIEEVEHEWAKAFSGEMSSEYLGIVGTTRVNFVSPTTVDMTFVPFVQHDAATTAPIAVVGFEH